MDANILRVVKIDKEALYEFIYENFIAQQEELLDIAKSEVMNDFAIDWGKGEFLFTQSSATYSNLNSQASVEEVKNLLSTHTIIRRKQIKELNL